MPTGVAFFTGNATVQLASNVKNITLPVKQEAPRVARPNENIDTFETATTTYLDHKTVHEAESSDSDVTVRDEDLAGFFRRHGRSPVGRAASVWAGSIPSGMVGAK